MVLSELAVTGLRCIEHAELEIAAGLARVWGDTGSGETTLSEAMLLPDRGRLSFIRNSSGLKQLEQDHLRVISASLALLGIQARALRSAGTHHGACLPGTACVARLRGSDHLGSDMGERNLVPVSAHRPVRRFPSMNPFDFRALALPVCVRSKRCLWEWLPPRSGRFELCAQ